MILIIDNYDSFVYSLFQCLGESGEDVIVKRNDKVTIEEIRTFSPKKIVLSPGPGHPTNKKDFGICDEIISSFHVPIMGVCLGHQGIITHFGGKVERALKPMHGKTSNILHSRKGIFEGIKNPLQVMRYHSLTGTEIPDCLEITAKTIEANIKTNIETTVQTGMVMAVQHKTLPIYGVQFHPESIMTEDGKKIIENFVRL